MRRLIALDLPGSPRFVDELERVWEDGDALMPVDRRWPRAMRDDLLATFGAAELVTETDRVALATARPVDDGDAAVIATSGSTGRPKGVVLTHDAIATSAAATSTRLEVTADDHWLACLPLAHVGGLSVVFRALHTGTKLSVHDGFDARRVMDSGATLVSLVSAVLPRIDPTAFRTIVLGGARPPANRPPNSVTTYGMTETGSGVVYDGQPLDGVEIRIDADRILLRCPMLFRAYRDGTDPKDSAGWFDTGDLGEIGPDGRLQVFGRHGDLIISGGENVWPEPVEAALRSVPDVVDAAVLGVDDPEWGQRVEALVVPTDPASPPSLARLRDAVEMVLPRYCAPRGVTFVGSLPRTSLGKLKRSDLHRDGR